MRTVNLVHLYPKEMNIYGDTGNSLVLQQRLIARDIEVKFTHVGIGDFIPTDTDIIIGGGGQDAGQSVVQHDLAAKANDLHKLAADGVVMLMVCGLYQLFGRRFVTGEGEEITGINLLPLETIAGKTRHIGNTIYEIKRGKTKFEIVGYENHSGLTYLDDPANAFARVSKGAGNNGQDRTEGCLLNNVIGTYSHGPILSKNPEFADELIRRALKRKYGDIELHSLDDYLEHKAAELAKKRPR
jgi:lipid II isoglutaminyl synthase (glutamine-hydrolysing)